MNLAIIAAGARRDHRRDRRLQPAVDNLDREQPPLVATRVERAGVSRIAARP